MKKTIPQRSTFCTEDEGVIVINNDWMSPIFFFFFTGPGLKYPDNTDCSLSLSRFFFLLVFTVLLITFDNEINDSIGIIECRKLNPI